MRLVSRDLFLELIDQPLERLHLQFAQMLVLGVGPRFFVALLQQAELPLGILELAIALQVHRITSTMPLGASNRSVAKKLTKRSKRLRRTSAISRNGRPARSSASATGSLGNPRPVNRTQSTSFGSIISVTKLPFKTIRWAPARIANSTIHRTDSICTRRSSDSR